MKNIFLVFILFFGLSSKSQELDKEFKADALKVIQMSGVVKQLELVKEQLLPMIPKGKRADFLKDFEASLPELYDSYAKTYMKLYTKEDLKAMIAYYESPVGKKIQANADEMVLRSQANGKEWMSKLQSLITKYQLTE